MKPTTGCCPLDNDLIAVIDDICEFALGFMDDNCQGSSCDRSKNTGQNDSGFYVDYFSRLCGLVNHLAEVIDEPVVFGTKCGVKLLSDLA